MQKKSIVVLASGNGSNFEAIVQTFRRDQVPIEVVALITDNPRAYAIERARRLGVPVHVLDSQSYPSRDAYNQALLDLLRSLSFDLMVLAGYMKILPPEIVRAYERRIVNIHPALLPAYRGLHAIERAFQDGVQVTGVTVHWVDEGVDTGPILAQVPVWVDPDDTLESLEEKIHRVEHQLYPRVIQRILLGEDARAHVRRALLSVSDRTGLLDLAQQLLDLGYTLIATDGTYRYLQEHGIDSIPTQTLTGFPQILEGRVKTLHPALFGSVLAERTPEHLKDLDRFLADPIDVVVINFYPLPDDLSRSEALQSMDIGGPALVRAAIKNSSHVFVATSPEDYGLLIEGLQGKEDPSKVRKILARRAFHRVMAYLRNFSSALETEEPPEYLTFHFQKATKLRYGENPHQEGYLYRSLPTPGAPTTWQKLWGKDLSYTNYLDLDSAVHLVWEFEGPACVIVKHLLPCGVALGSDPLEAYEKALASDPVSVFGGIVAFNRPIGREVAEKLNEMFLDIVAAPAFEEDALPLLQKKKNRRLVIASEPDRPAWIPRFLGGDLLLQNPDRVLEVEFDVHAPEGQPTELSESDLKDLLFGLYVIRYVKSNATLLVKDQATVGVGGGQPSRVDSVKIALEKAGDRAQRAMLITDGFFPFPDSVELAAQHGVRVVVEPGGSIRDAEVIQRAKELGVTLVLTGVRHFTH